VYTVSSGAFSSYSGVGTYAQWSPDAKTLYVVGTDQTGTIPTMFVNNINTGWTTYPLANGQPAVEQTTPASQLAMTVPGIGAFLSGYPTVAFGWCPTLNSATGYIQQAYPQIAAVDDQTDILGATINGSHILGVSKGSGSPQLTDINVNFSQSLNNGACPATSSGGIFTSSNITTSPVTANPQTPIVIPAGVALNAFEQVLPSPASNLAFITYSAQTGSTGTANLPYYTPATGSTAGPVNYVTLSGAPTAPIAGAFSLDDTLFFVSTSGDNQVHYINLTGATPVDSQQITPGLVDLNGNPLPATAIAVKPRSTT
jgi:hypothetical protein